MYRTGTSCVVGSHQIVCMCAVCLSVGFPPMLTWYSYLLSEPGVYYTGNYLSSFLMFLPPFFLSLSQRIFLSSFGLRFLSQFDSVWQPVPCLNYSDKQRWVDYFYSHQILHKLSCFSRGKLPKNNSHLFFFVSVNLLSRCSSTPTSGSSPGSTRISSSWRVRGRGRAPSSTCATTCSAPSPRRRENTSSCFRKEAFFASEK
jgi:hypothetical protein